MKTKILVVAILLVAFCVNCDKKELEPDYTAFLNITTPRFSGNIDGESFNWRLSTGVYQSSNSIVNGISTLYDLNENERILTYSLTSPSNSLIIPDFCNSQENNGITNGLDISAPKFNYVSDDILDSSLQLGKTNIGGFENAFNISVYVDGKKYCVRNSFDGVEVLKTELTEVAELQYALVWLVLNDMVLDAAVDDTSINISNGKIIARFLLE